MATVWLSEPAENELKQFAHEDQQYVAAAILLLEDDNYRELNKLDLNLVEQGYSMFSLIVGIVWLGFHEDSNGDICIDWVSLRSRFRT